MGGWTAWLREWMQWVRTILRRGRVRRAMRDLAQARIDLQSAQNYLAGVVTRLKEVKAGFPPNPALVDQLEGDIQHTDKEIERQRARIRDLERRLNELDPDRTIRSSLPPQ